jgi:hypothetical protein
MLCGGSRLNTDMPTRSRLTALLVLALCAHPLLASGPKPTSASARTTAAPGFSPAGGVFTKTQVKLSGPGTIYYTVDGSEPTEKSSRYSTPIIVSESTLIRARAFEPGIAGSPIVAQSYTIADRKVLDFNSNLPLVIINTFGRQIQRNSKTQIAVRVVDVDSSKRSKLSGKADFDGAGSLNFRGNTSLRYPKRSYTLKTRAGDGEPFKTPLLGLPKESDWVLYAPYPDKSLIRDVLAYDLSNKMGAYAPHTRFVELFVSNDGKVTMEDYQGVYVLVEKIKRSKERVNIAKLAPEDNKEPDISGGYIFKKDHTDKMGGIPMATDMGMPDHRGSTGPRSGFPTDAGGFPAKASGFIKSSGTGRSPANNGPPRRGMRRVVPAQDQPGNFVIPDLPLLRGAEEEFIPNNLGFGTPKGNQFYYVEPKGDEITAAQKKWLSRYVDEFERTLYGPKFRDPAEGYAKYIDVDSFIDQHILVEATKNVDGFRFSTFYSKDRGGKIRMGPMWDWNLAFGNVNGKQGWLPRFWYWPQLDDQQYTWFRRLFQDPDFGQRYVDRWAMLRTNVFATSNILARVDELAAQLDEAQKRNFKRWPVLGRTVWPNHYVGDTYQEEIDWLKNYTRERLDWIDAQFVAAPDFSRKSSFLPKDNNLTLTPKSGGQIYYTVDGSDPRAPGGAPSGSAKVYKEPILMDSKTKVFARAFEENLWSSPVRAQYNTK